MQNSDQLNSYPTLLIIFTSRIGFIYIYIYICIEIHGNLLTIGGDQLVPTNPSQIPLHNKSFVTLP